MPLVDRPHDARDLGRVERGKTVPNYQTQRRPIRVLGGARVRGLVAGGEWLLARECCKGSGECFKIFIRLS